MNEKELLDLKKRADAVKEELSEARGRQKYLMQRIQSETDCTTVDEVEQKLKDLEEDFNRYTEQIEEKVTEIKQKYPSL